MQPYLPVQTQPDPEHAPLATPLEILALLAVQELS